MESPTEILIRKKGLRVTSSRTKILNTIAQSSSALTCAQLVKSFSKELDQATIYRVLDAFNEAGILHRFADIEGDTRYALCEFDTCDKEHKHDAHMHFKCRRCGNVTCLPQIKTLEVDLPVGFQMTNMTVNGEGYCKLCSLNS